MSALSILFKILLIGIGIFVIYFIFTKINLQFDLANPFKAISSNIFNAGKNTYNGLTGTPGMPQI